MKIRILSSAERDLEEGYRFYESQSPGLGSYFLDSLYSDIDSLACFGGIHQLVFGYHRQLSKRFPFAVYYRLIDNGVGPFRPLYDGLSHMGFYNLNPDEIRELQPPDTGEVLKRDGSNLASVLGTMAKENSKGFDRVVAFLSKVVPGIQGIDVKHVGRKETIEFRQLVGNSKDAWHFMAENMSDGTLRALGVLTALFQSSRQTAKRVPFVGIEEPEVAVHPGAAGVLRDGLVSAAKTTQISVTSHSPDLLDDKDIPDEGILAVVNRNGETRIAPLDEAGRSAIRDRLYTAGELLRLNQIEPDEETLAKLPPSQLELFADYKP